MIDEEAGGGGSENRSVGDWRLLEQPINIFNVKRNSDQGRFMPPPAGDRHDELPLLLGNILDDSYDLQCRETNIKLSTIVRDR